MIWVYRFLRGYLRVVFKGDSPQRILSLSAKNQITLWDTGLARNGLETYIYIKDFYKLPQIIRKSGLRAHILAKKGLPIILGKNRFRLGFFGGIIMFFAFLQIMSGYIWVIDVTGNKSVPTEDIINACETIGIRQGVKANKIDSKVQRERLLLKVNGLAWASLNVEGSRLTVNVSEIKNMQNEKMPSNLKAALDGIVKHIDVTSGDCVVKVGDTVKRGDVLVSGVKETSDGTVFIHSSGSIIAETLRYYKAEESFEQSLKIPDGRVKTKYVLELFNIKIPLYLGCETDEYTSSRSSVTARLFGKSLPIKIYGKRFEFYRTGKIIYSPEELEAKLEKQITEQIKEEKIEEYEVTERRVEKNEKGIIMSYGIKTLENIALNEGIIVKN